MFREDSDILEELDKYCQENGLDKVNRNGITVSVKTDAFPNYANGVICFREISKKGVSFLPSKLEERRSMVNSNNGSIHGVFINIPVESMEFYTDNGTTTYNTRVVNKGKDISITGAVVGGILGGTAGAIIGAGKDKNKGYTYYREPSAGNKTYIYFHKNNSPEISVIEITDGYYFDVIKGFIPEKEYSNVMMRKQAQQLADSFKPDEVQKEEKSPQNTSTVKMVSFAGASESNLLKRGYLALEDAEWEQADMFFEGALNVNAESGPAYIGKFLVERKEATLDDFIEKEIERNQDANFEVAMVPVTDEIDAWKNKVYEIYKDKVPAGTIQEALRKATLVDIKYKSAKKSREQQLAQIDSFGKDKNLKKALRFEKDADEIKASVAMKQLRDAMQERYLSAMAEDEASVATINANIKAAMKEAETSLADAWAEVQKKREDEENERRAREVARAEAERREEEKRRAASQKAELESLEKKKTTYGMAVSIYNNARSKKKYKEAAEMFASLDSFKDSFELSRKCYDEIDKINKKHRKITGFLFSLFIFIAIVIMLQVADMNNTNEFIVFIRSLLQMKQ